jgi:hypothetical protein
MVRIFNWHSETNKKKRISNREIVRFFIRLPAIVTKGFMDRGDLVGTSRQKKFFYHIKHESMTCTITSAIGRNEHKAPPHESVPEKKVLVEGPYRIVRRGREFSQ